MGSACSARWNGINCVGVNASANGELDLPKGTAFGGGLQGERTLSWQIIRHRAPDRRQNAADEWTHVAGEHDLETCWRDGRGVQGRW